MKRKQYSVFMDEQQLEHIDYLDLNSWLRVHYPKVLREYEKEASKYITE